jgi:hypothetical protein
MSKYGVLLPRSAPRSLVDPVGEKEQSDIRLRRDGPTFDEILEGQMPSGMLKLSEGVKDALKLHGLELTPLELDTISGAVDDLADAGRERGLVLSERGAFIVDVGKREVESVFPKEQLKSELIEGIDSFIGV